MMRWIGLLILLIPLVSLGQVKVTAILDSTYIITGDQFHLTVKVVYPKEASIIQLDLSELNQLDYIEILGEKDFEELKTDDGNLFEKQLTLTSFDSGYHYIPKIPVVIKIGDHLDTFFSTSPAFEVALLPLESEEASLMPIKEIIKEPIGFEDILPYLVGALVIVLIVALFIFFKKRRIKIDLGPQEKIDLRTPYQIAIQKLEALDLNKFLSEGTVKEFHFELSLIFRGYLEDTYNRPALESTLKEVKEMIQLIGLDQGVINSFFKNMDKAELIKFAKLQADGVFHSDFYNQVKRIINIINLHEEEKKLSESEENSVEE
jgi:hypothetical protein